MRYIGRCVLFDWLFARCLIVELHASVFILSWIWCSILVIALYMHTINKQAPLEPLGVAGAIITNQYLYY